MGNFSDNGIGAGRHATDPDRGRNSSAWYSKPSIKERPVSMTEQRKAGLTGREAAALGGRRTSQAATNRGYGRSAGDSGNKFADAVKSFFGVQDLETEIASTRANIQQIDRLKTAKQEAMQNMSTIGTAALNSYNGMVQHELETIQDEDSSAAQVGTAMAALKAADYYTDREFTDEVSRQVDKRRGMMGKLRDSLLGGITSTPNALNTRELNELAHLGKLDDAVQGMSEGLVTADKYGNLTKDPIGQYTQAFSSLAAPAAFLAAGPIAGLFSGPLAAGLSNALPSLGMSMMVPSVSPLGVAEAVATAPAPGLGLLQSSGPIGGLIADVHTIGQVNDTLDLNDTEVSSPRTVDVADTGRVDNTGSSKKDQALRRFYEANMPKYAAQGYQVPSFDDFKAGFESYSPAIQNRTLSAYL